MASALDIMTGLRQFIDAYKSYSEEGDQVVVGMEMTYQYVLDRFNDSISDMADEFYDQGRTD